MMKHLFYNLDVQRVRLLIMDNLEPLLLIFYFSFDCYTKKEVRLLSFSILKRIIDCYLETITKDDDFINWVILKNPPPQIIWLTIGNAKNGILLDKILNAFPETINQLLETKSSFIELN